MCGWFGLDTPDTAPMYFQLGAPNPKAGQPVSLSASGLPQPGGTTDKTGGTVTLQPDFINSNIRNKTLPMVFAS